MKPNLKSLRLTMLLLLSSLALLSYAVPAYPGLIDFKQPDGNIVKIRMKGSESLKWAETEDGYTLLYDKVGNLVYAELDNKGDLVPSDFVATDIALRPTDVIKRLQATPKRLTYSPSQQSIANQVYQARAKQMVVTPNSPVVGTRKILLILVEFSDYSFKKSKNDFDKLMNQLNYTDGGRYGSVRDYFKENSFDQLDLVTDVAGIYRLSNKRSYYGGNDGAGNDKNPRAMAQEAVTMANADVDFSQYDTDKDGIVDGIHIIYAGPGEEAGGGSDCIWAHAWTVAVTVDGKSTSHYSCSPEIRGSGGSNITHIGVICHEIGHVLGTKDFYDTNYGTGGEYPGTGDWDIMGTGSWNGDGACPAHFNPFTKIYDYAWAVPTVVSDTYSAKLEAKTKNGFIQINTRSSDEFFLLEYKCNRGFDSKLPGHGLMIYRAAENLSLKEFNTINAYHRQQFYPIVANASSAIPTDDPSTYGNVNSSAAPFPGTTGVTEFTDYSTPSMKSWNKYTTKLPITSIKENTSEGYVTFDIAAKFDYLTIDPQKGDVENLDKITLTFPKAVHIDKYVGTISLKSITDPDNDHAKSIEATVSSDGLSATLLCAPSKSAWTPGVTYKLSIPAGYFVDDSSGLLSKAINVSWKITNKTFSYIDVNPAQGEVPELKDILISFPNDVYGYNGASLPKLYIIDASGRFVATLQSEKTSDANGNAALKATIDPAITADGTYSLICPAKVLGSTEYGGNFNEAFMLTWNVVSPQIQDFAPTVNPTQGEVSIDEIKTTIITLPSPVNTFDSSSVCFTNREEQIWHDNVATSTISDDRLSITITWDFAPKAGCDYKLLLPAGCIILDNGAKNVETEVTYTIANNIAESIILDKTIVEIAAKENFSLSAIVLPDNTTDKTVTWKSSDNTVATVDSNGLVTAVAIGKAIITATTTDGSNLSASCVVTVIPTPGDVNNDGNINITDVVTVASYVLGNTPHTFIFDAADLTNDGTINIVDIVTIANIILNNEAPEEALYASRVATQYAMESRFFIEDFSIQAKETKTIAVNLTNDIAFSGFQADIKLPEGLELCQEDGEYMISLSTRKSNDHVLTSAMRSDGTIRLLCYSMSLNEFDDTEGALVYLTVTAANNFIGNYEISLNNITFTQADLSEYSLEPTICHLTSTSGIEDVNSGIIVTTIESGIVVKNAPLGSNIRVYAADGSIVASKVAIDGNVVIAAPIKSLYIVTVDGKSFKVMMK